MGVEYARILAEHGLNLVLIARNADRLLSVAKGITERFRVEVRPVVADLSRPDTVKTIAASTEDVGIGLLVYNAGISNPGWFLDRPVDSHLQQLQVNCHTPLALAHHFGGRMREHGRGGIILMSSLSAFAGSPEVAGYGASKAFNVVLAEGLAFEFRRYNVDVLVCCAGVIAGGAHGAQEPLHRRRSIFAPPETQPRFVAEYALRNLGRRSVVIPGHFNQIASFAMTRILPRSFAVRLMARTVQELEFPTAP